MRGQTLEVKERYGWRKGESGCWSLSLGERGSRVRVTQREPGGVFFRTVWLPGEGKTQCSLQTRSRTEARLRAERFLRDFLKAGVVDEPPALTLEDLWNRYREEAPAFRANTRKTQEGKRRSAKYLMVGFGRQKLVEKLCPHDVEVYIERRRAGLHLPNGSALAACRNRTIEADLQLLRTMLNWACTVRTMQGPWLLAENPLRGVRLPKETRPNRAIATQERFEATLACVRELQNEATTGRGRRKWILIELALHIGEAFGRRRGALVGLRWSDISFEAADIFWRAEFDKARREKRVPMPQGLLAKIQSIHERLQITGEGWVFSTVTGETPWPPEILSQALLKAERRAGLKKLLGSVWHAYRRKWVTERKHCPVADVMAAGGWVDMATLQTCYQLSDPETVRLVMDWPTKLRDRDFECTGTRNGGETAVTLKKEDGSASPK